MPIPPLIAVLVAPRRTLEGRIDAAKGRRAPGTAAILALGLGWAGFSLALHFGGHAPSLSLLPIPPSRYYLAQSLFVVPLWLGLWQLATEMAHRIACALGAPRRARGVTSTVMAYALAAPMLALFLLPDVLVYATLGFDRLGEAMRYYAALGPLAAWALASLGLKIGHGLATWRAIIAAFWGLMMQAVVGAPFLR
jgi:hypothetical protein